MTFSRVVLRGSVAVCALVGSLWAIRVMLETNARALPLFAGIVAGLCGATAIGLGAADDSPRLGALAAAPIAILLGLKPYVAPLTYEFRGEVSTFSPAAETHLYYLVPGFLLAVAALGVSVLSTSGSYDARAEQRRVFRILGGSVGLLAAAALLLSFTDSRGTLDMVLLGLVPSGLVGVGSVASLVRGGDLVATPPALAFDPYRALPQRSAVTTNGGSTDALLRALAHAPAPGAHALPPELFELPPGSRMGSFIVRERLGAGGMGVVYRAHDARLNRDVALKLLPAHLSHDASRRARFFREARTAASVHHPHVAAVFELGEMDPPYIAMELVDGETLRRVIARGYVGRSEVHRIALAIATGLAAAHARGVVHRDLKPENIMMARDGMPKIVDFGLARENSGPADPHGPTAVQSALTETGVIVGTPRYMAPEQAAGGEVDARVDIYAFGILLVELSSGTGLDPVTPAVRRAEAGRALVAMNNPELGLVVERCLAFDPSGRYPDGSAVVEALRTAAPVDRAI